MADSHSHHPATAGHGDVHSHASHDDAHHVAKHIRGYLIIGASLLVLTIVTVALAYVDFGSHNKNIIVALIVATFKASLVAAIFMHLKGERATIWRMLFFTAIFVSGLFLLTWLHESNPIPGTTYSQKANN